MKRQSLRSIGLGVAILGATVLAGSLSGSSAAIAGTEVPITEIRFAGGDNGTRMVIAQLVVPGRDTTRSAYGGSLRRYDVHLAKMFEVTLFEYCDPSSNWNAVSWRYYANDGETFMGQFDITCKQARQVEATYGLGRLERTFIAHRGGPAREEYVPVLDLNGRKIPQWLKFTQNFRPKFQ